MSDTTIKVMDLLEEVEDILENSGKFLLTDKSIIDGKEILDIIEEIRINMPKDIQQAKWVKDEQDRILSEAKTEYDRIVIDAKKQAEYLVESNAIKKEAEKKAETILNEAENHNRYMKLRTYEYVDKLIYDMQNSMAKISEDYFTPMYEYLENTIQEVDSKFDSNRSEIKSLAAKVHESTNAKDEETEK
ncbi:MAG: ATP synthase F0 subunit B [Clostridiales bacterium]|nr:ATP synthase F0 subunit B [Clostridiales bacterium]